MFVSHRVPPSPGGSRTSRPGTRTAHGITLPSLGVDLPTFTARYRTPPLLALGNCNLSTARALADALRKGVM